MIASLSAFAVDIAAFALFISLYFYGFPNEYIILATYSAKILSFGYSYIVNKKLVFINQAQGIIPVLKFSILCIVQASASALLVNYLFKWFLQNEILTKIIVDSVLFFFSFKIQQGWVFGKKIRCKIIFKRILRDIQFYCWFSGCSCRCLP